MTTTKLPPRVYVVILNWNGWRDTIECLDSVLKCDYANIHPIVCDNASTDGSVEEILKWSTEQHLSTRLLGHSEGQNEFDQTEVVTIDNDARLADGANLPGSDFTLIETGSNLGYAGGNNVGIRYAKEQGDCDYVWILNPDTVVEKVALARMVTHSEELRNKGTKNVCGSVLCFYDAPEIIQALGGTTFNSWTGRAHDAQGKYASRNDYFDHTTIARKLGYVLGCSMLVPASFIDEIGYLEESYFLYYEEADWALRSKGKYEITYSPDAIVYHKVGASIGSRKLSSGPSAMSDFYMARSRKKFMRKFFPNRMFFVWIGLLLQALNRMRQGHPSNAWQILRVASGLDRQF